MVLIEHIKIFYASGYGVRRSLDSHGEDVRLARLEAPCPFPHDAQANRARAGIGKRLRNGLIAVRFILHNLSQTTTVIRRESVATDAVA